MRVVAIVVSEEPPFEISAVINWVSLFQDDVTFVVRIALFSAEVR